MLQASLPSVAAAAAARLAQERVVNEGGFLLVRPHLSTDLVNLEENVVQILLQVDGIRNHRIEQLLDVRLH